MAKFETKADWWGDGTVRTIIIENKNGVVLLVGGKQAKMEYNGLQLRFKVQNDLYIVFNNDSSHHHNPPKPIAEMYRELGGK